MRANVACLPSTMTSKDIMAYYFTLVYHSYDIKWQQNRETGRMTSEKIDEKTSVCFYVGARVVT